MVVGAILAGVERGAVGEPGRRRRHGGDEEEAVRDGVGHPAHGTRRALEERDRRRRERVPRGAAVSAVRGAAVGGSRVAAAVAEVGGPGRRALGARERAAHDCQAQEAREDERPHCFTQGWTWTKGSAVDAMPVVPGTVYCCAAAPLSLDPSAAARPSDASVTLPV